MESIEHSGHTVSDIAWVGEVASPRAHPLSALLPESSSGIRFDTEEFLRLAKNTNYDAGYGGVEIPFDLKVMFTDGSYLRRSEYDGSEWWDYMSAPKEPETLVHLDLESLRLPEGQYDLFEKYDIYPESVSDMLKLKKIRSNQEPILGYDSDDFDDVNSKWDEYEDRYGGTSY